MNLRIQAIVVSMFMCGTVASVFTRDTSPIRPGDILAQARQSESQTGIALLQDHLSRAGELTLYYQCELARLNALASRWDASLSWSRKVEQSKAGIPEELADSYTFWYGQALERLQKPDEALVQYTKRLDTGKARDPALYQAYFRLSSRGAAAILARFNNFFSPTGDPRTYALTQYLAGLSAVREGDWNTAIQSLSLFLDRRTQDLKDYESWAHFYRSWSQYRAADWTRALAGFDLFLDGWPSHERSFQAAGAAALSALQVSRDPLPYIETALRLASTPAEKAETLILKATVLSDRQQWDAARDALNPVADGTIASVDGGQASRALFMQGDIAFRRGDLRLSESLWTSVASRYPRHPLAEEALFRSAEAWFITNDWARSITLYSRYRKEWPSGRFIEQVLLSGAYALAKNGQTSLAILWWEYLLNSYPKSPLASAAYPDVIESYRLEKDYPAALKLARKWKTLFPKEATEAGVDRLIATMERLAAGENEDTGTLMVEYEGAGRATTARGREAGLALARAYALDAGNRNRAKPLLEEITAKTPGQKALEKTAREERLVFAAAWSLLATLDRQDNAHVRSARAYLSSGSIYAPLDGERAAEALYGAIDSFVQGKKHADAQTTYQTLIASWPDSRWTARAGMLLSAHPTEKKR